VAFIRVLSPFGFLPKVIVKRLAPGLGSLRRSTPRRGCSKPDTEQDLQRLFRDSGWTDFLPVVLPTEERVEAMPAGRSAAGACRSARPGQ
jgi:hypothetical protein